MEEDAGARDVEGGGNFLVAGGFRHDGADANRSRNEGAAFDAAILGPLVRERCSGCRRVVTLFGDKLFGDRVHFRDDLFLGDFGCAAVFAVSAGGRIAARGTGGLPGGGGDGFEVHDFGQERRGGPDGGDGLLDDEELGATWVGGRGGEYGGFRRESRGTEFGAAEILRMRGGVNCLQEYGQHIVGFLVLGGYFRSEAEKRVAVGGLGGLVGKKGFGG